MAIVVITDDDGNIKRTQHFDRADFNSRVKAQGWQEWFMSAVLRAIDDEEEIDPEEET